MALFHYKIKKESWTGFVPDQDSYFYGLIAMFAPPILFHLCFADVPIYVGINSRLEAYGISTVQSKMLPW